MKFEIPLLVLIALAGSVTSFMFGGWGSLLSILTFLMIVDYLTGLIAAGLEKKLCSRIGFRGIAKKVLVFVLISVAHMLDIVMGVGHMIRDATAFFYIMNEIISIIENAKRVGLPIPPIIEKVINVLKNKSKNK